MQVRKIMETCLYVRDLDRTQAFYTKLLGAELHSRVDGRHVFFRVGDSMLLCFIAATTLTDSQKSPHGAKGCQHLAFEVPSAEYEEWKVRVQSTGIEILQEVDWKPGVHSFYFHDPDGHLLELVEVGLWS